MNKKLTGSFDFKATTGWLLHFKSRSRIRELNIQDKKLSFDIEAAELFKDSFKKIIAKEG